MPALAAAPGRSDRDPIAAAEAARLHHVDDRRPGLRRRSGGKTVRSGKRLVPAFVILDPNGLPVRDEPTLARIRGLAIPPAWTDVWICPSPNGHLQATGRDARGRKQYRYHARWRAHRDETKYARMIEFAGILPALRRRVAADLVRPGLPQDKVLATVVRLLETTFIRVGNEEYARSNHSFGLTTLEDRHVDFRHGGARFHFRGKSGVFHQVEVSDPVLARIVRQCRDLPGQELFQYRDGDGRPRTIDSADVNGYIQRQMGQGFTAKDFRTWAGTVLAAGALRAGAAQTSGRLDTGGRRAGPRGESAPPRASVKAVTRAIEQVAERLRNTPSVCRKCYIHPAIIAAYFDGSLGQRVGPRAGPRATGLRADEVVVLALLRRQAELERPPARRPSGLAGRSRRAAA
jgi:DNA topoisomerase-1